MAVLPTKHRPSAAKERRDRRRERNCARPSTAEEEPKDESPERTHCSATAAAATTMAVLPTKHRPSAAEEWRDRRRRGRNFARPSTSEEEPKDEPPERSDKGRITALADSYEMLKKIGEGAYGAVRKARHIESGETVAIKSSLNPGVEAAAALLREAAMLAACAGNPAVVRIREVARGSDMRELHLVMEYVGRSLAAVIRSRRRRGQGSFTEPEARDVMAQLLAGVKLMHAQGIIHSDLKPANVLVGEKHGRFKICDFGLAKSVISLPTDTNLEGTPGYMAPELLLGQKHCGTPIDVWALGCIMAEILTGEPLFTAENLYEQLISIIHLLGIPDNISLMPLGVESLETPNTLRERVSEELLSPKGFDVLQGLLEYDPKNRLTASAALKMLWFATKDDTDDLGATQEEKP